MVGKRRGDDNGGKEVGKEKWQVRGEEMIMEGRR